MRCIYKNYYWLFEMVIEEWHEFVKTKNIKILDRILSEDVIFYSPALHTPKVGIEVTKSYLFAAANLLFDNNGKYISEIIGENIFSSEFEGYLDDIYYNGVDIISCNSSNKITSFKVFVRPLKGLLILKEKMSQELSKN